MTVRLISLTQIDEDIKTVQTSQTLKEEIKILEAHHIEDLERICDMHAFDYLDEAKTRYFAKDPALIKELDRDNDFDMEGSGEVSLLCVDSSI